MVSTSVATRRRLKVQDLPRPLRGLGAAARELRTLIGIGPALARYAFTSPYDLYRRSLPVQAPLRREVPAEARLADLEAFLAWVGGETAGGEDSVYLAPGAWKASPLAFLADAYPAGCGLKISRGLGDAGAAYLQPRPGRKLQQQLSGSHRDQVLTYALLNLEGLGPRLLDLVELADPSGAVRCAYVVEHVEGGPPDAAAFEAVVGRLKALGSADLLNLVSGGGWGGIDFAPPDGNGNVVVSSRDGRALYVDVHNFTLGRYDRYLTDLARTASAASHFGNTSALLGGSYLYQEVPGVPLPGKRSPQERFRTYDRLMAEAGIGSAGKAVVDVGCNLGLMSAEHLRRGATWMHGFDMPEVAAQAERVLLGIGCTRFSTTGGLISRELDLRAALPAFMRGLPRDGVLLNYLAIRLHVGWLPGLKQLNWRYMLYEGHQGDQPLESYLAELQPMIPVRIAARGQVSDANSAPRDAAIIERLD